MSIKNIGYELTQCAKALVKGTTYQSFRSSDYQTQIVAKTMTVAFAAGLLGQLLLSIPVITGVAGGTLAFAYFTRNTPYSNNVFQDAFNEIVDGVKNMGARANNALNSWISWVEK